MLIFELFVLQGGDADANAAVAGALLGCKLGLDGIPKSWMEPLKHRVWLDDLIDKYVHIYLCNRNMSLFSS